jgi:non-specific serine/threonine protein kinase
MVTIELTATLLPSPTPTPTIWQEVAKMPSARSEMSAGVIDGRIYVPGGWGNGYDQSIALEMYDPATDSWTRLADLPFHVNHHATAVYNDALYVFGPEAAALRYDPAANAWEALAPMPEDRWAGAAAALGDFLYFVGGSGSSSDLLRYDPNSDSWTRLAPLLQSREHTQAVALNGQLYALGGRWDRGLNSVERYDPATDTWTRAPSMNQPRSGFGAAVWDGKIVIAGGELISPLAIIDTIEIFDPEKNRWEMAEVSLPVPLHGLPIAIIDHALYVLGGSGLAGDVSNRGRVYRYYLDSP